MYELPQELPSNLRHRILGKNLKIDRRHSLKEHLRPSYVLVYSSFLKLFAKAPGLNLGTKLSNLRSSICSLPK